MKTDVIRIYSDLKGSEEAMATAEKFCEYNGFEGRNAKHIRLLTEELLSMVHGIMENFRGDMWFESQKGDEGTLCRICLRADKAADCFQEEYLLSVASSGKNENAKGILGKIREAFRVSTQHANDGVYMNEYTSVNNWFSMGAAMTESASARNYRCWSLKDYQRRVYDNRENAAEELDELEKSIIAKIADDVKVWLRSETTELVAEKLIK